MTDPEKLQRLLDEACRLGDVQACEIAEKSNQARLLRNAVRKAYEQLRSGRTESARQTLRAALQEAKS